MSESNSVFISYRRDISGYTALAVFQYLRDHGIYAFVDHKSIPAGQFEPVILGQIAARPYFVVILAPGCLKRCNEPGDWLRREIEYAMELKRKIIPLLTSDFNFKARYAKPYLTGKLAELPSYEGQKAPLEFFEEALDKLLRLLKPIDLPTTPTPDAEKTIVNKIVEEAASQSRVTKQQFTAQEYFERAMARNDNSAEEIADYTEAIRLNPEYADAYFFRGLARWVKDNLDGAIADFSEAIRLNPERTEAYFLRGNARTDNGDLDDAIADYEKALRLNPKYADVYYGRALARADKENFAGAIADGQKALDLGIDDSYVETIQKKVAEWQKLIEE